MNPVSKAKRHIARARELSHRVKSRLPKMKEAQVIAKVRKDRQMIWESKFAARS
jgi:hypothetical protein